MTEEDAREIAAVARKVATEFRDFAAKQEDPLLTGWNFAVATGWIRFAVLIEEADRA